MMDDENDDGGAVIYCPYGQCADAAVPCPRCMAILCGPGSVDDQTITYAELCARRAVAETPQKH